MYHLHPETAEFLWRCPLCGQSLRFQTQAEVNLAEQAGACEGCRAKAMFKRTPEMIGLLVALWARSDAWPESVSWMEAIPASGISILGNAYQARGILPGMHASIGGSITL
jgi:hypothetical protein